MDPITHPLGNIRRERYCIATMNGHSAEDSYKIAGYKGRSKGAVRCVANNKWIVARIAGLQEYAAEKAVSSSAVTKNEIIESLRDTRRLAKSGTAILDREGNDTGERKMDLSSANRSDEIMAKMHGFMLDVTRKETLDEELDGKNPEELRSFVLSLLEQLDPNMRKMVMSEIESEARSAPDGETLQ